MRILDFADGFESNEQPSTGGVSATTVSIDPIVGLDAENAQEAFEELQLEKVAKVNPSVDNTVPRFNGTSGDLQTSGVTVDDSNNVTGVNDLTVNGNLTVQGTQTILNTQTLEVEDKAILVNKGGNATSAAGSGVEVEENGVVTGKVVVSSDRNAFEIKAPNTAGVASVIPGGSNDEVALLAKAQLLSNKTLVLPVTDIVTFDGQPSSPSAPSAGNYKLYFKDDGKAYKQNSAGQEKQLGGSGGAGGKNYAEDLFDGTSITGINQYADSGSTPTDGTGGSPAGLTTALNSSTPLRGTSSQRFSKDGSNRQGQGWSWDFTLDLADYEASRPIKVTFKYKCSSNYANNDLRLFIYDRDGATTPVNIISLTNDGSVALSTVPIAFTGYFYPTTGNNDYRLIFHIAGTTASAWDFDLIDFTVGPDVEIVPGGILVDLGTEAWTDNQGNATTSVKLFRRGKVLRVEGLTSYTGAQSGAMSITIPAAYTSASRYVFTNTKAYEIGLAQLIDSGTGRNSGEIHLTAANTLTVYTRSATSVTDLSSSSPFTWASGDSIAWWAEYEVEGWLESAALSTTETFLQTARMIATGNPATASSGNPIIYPTVTLDTNSAYNSTTGRYTVPSAGTYRLSFAINATIAAGTTFSIYKNASVANHIGYASNDRGWGTGLVVCATGDVIDLRANASVTSPTGTNNSLCIEKVPDFSLFGVFNQSTPWQVYIPTFTNFGSVTTQEFWYRREGPDLLIKGRFTSQSSSAAEGRVSFPLGLVSSSTLIHSTLEVCGFGQVAGTGTVGSFDVFCERNVSYVTFGFRDGSVPGLSKLNASTFLATANNMSFQARIPIAGW